MISGRLRQWLSLLVCVLAVILLKSEGASVGITYLQDAVAKGAGTDLSLFLYIFYYMFMHIICLTLLSFFFFWFGWWCVVCLDGSPPAYHFGKGSGAGVDNWIVHMEVSPLSFALLVLCIYLQKVGFIFIIVVKNVFCLHEGWRMV